MLPSSEIYYELFKLHNIRSSASALQSTLCSKSAYPWRHTGGQCVTYDTRSIWELNNTGNDGSEGNENLKQLCKSVTLLECAILEYFRATF